MKYTLYYVIFHIFYAVTTFSVAYATQQPCTFMINPFGDAGNAGRIIDGSYERGLTLQLAEELKEQFKKRSSQVRVILTRFPGERLEPLQNVNFANRLKTDFYLNIQCYYQEQDLTEITLYYYIQRPSDLWVQRPSQIFDFIPYDQAYQPFTQQTRHVAQMIAQELEKISHAQSFSIQGIFGYPCKPLMGIYAPALCIEIGLKNKDDWHRLVEPMSTCLNNVITKLFVRSS